jgi:uncharacterized membrane protein
MLIVAIITMILLDFTYIYLTRTIYDNLVRAIQGTDLKIKLIPALLVYFFLVGGLYYFILLPKRPIMDASILGLVMYAMFSLTNLAIFDKWSYKVVIMDSLWGAFLFAMTTFITYKLSK